MLNEYIITKHWDQRVNDRAVNISEIVYPPAIFENVENKEELKAALDERIKKIIRARLLAYQVLQDADSSKYVSTVIVSIQLRKSGKLYSPIFKVEGGDGNTYVGLSHNNTLLTLLVMPKEKIDPHSLTQRAIAHMKGTISEDDVEVKTASNYEALLDVDSTIQQMTAGKEAPMGVPKTAQDLPYKVKKDYLKSTPGRPNFITHKDYGRGEITQSEQGMGGKWNNVIVKFPIGVKTFRTLYADNFFLKKV
jgi:hypothetical protein